MSRELQSRNIAHLTPIVPAEGGNGLAMRTGMFAEAAARLGSRQVIVIGDDCSVEHNPDLEACLTHIAVAGRLDTRLRLINNIPDLKARSQALVSYGRPMATAGLSAPVLENIAKELKKHRWSCIIISRAHLLPILDIPGAIDAQTPVIVDLDDDDANLFRACAEAAMAKGEYGQAALHEAEAATYDKIICAAAQRVEIFTCASKIVTASLDARLGLKNINTIVNGISLAECIRIPRPTLNLLFVGNLSYMPNIDGICWFIEKIWPLLRGKSPELSFIVAGSRPDQRVRDVCSVPGIKLRENPKDLSPLYRQATAAIIPLRLGSGSRLKILEAAAHGVPVISTGQGAEGLELEPGHHLFQSVALEHEFAQACMQCLNHKQQAEIQAKNLRNLVQKNYNRSDKIEQISGLVKSVIR